MKKILFVILTSLLLVSCGSKVYNSQLKQVELGMTRNQVESIMGDKYIEHKPEESWGTHYEKIEYNDRYKFQWFFLFQDGKLVKWYKGADSPQKK